MLPYCLKCRKNSCNDKKRKNNAFVTMLCNSKKLIFLKQQEVSGLLSSLGIKARLNKIPLIGPLLF